MRFCDAYNTSCGSSGQQQHTTYNTSCGSSPRTHTRTTNLNCHEPQSSRGSVTCPSNGHWRSSQSQCRAACANCWSSAGLSADSVPNLVSPHEWTQYGDDGREVMSPARPPTAKLTLRPCRAQTAPRGAGCAWRTRLAPMSTCTWPTSIVGRVPQDHWRAGSQTDIESTTVATQFAPFWAPVIRLNRR